MKKSVGVVLIIVMLACFSVFAQTGSAKKEQVLKVAIGGDEGSLDPATGTTATPQQIIKAVYVGLFSFNENGKLKNEVCEKFEVSPDGKTYTFYLRKDAMWSDGVPVKAKDFVYGWSRNLVPALKASYSSLMSAIVNFSECSAGTKPLSEFGVKAKSDNVLVVSLTKTQPYFELMTTFSPFYPAREDQTPVNASSWSVKNVKSLATNGAFKLESYVANDKVVVVPNPYYFDKAKVKLSRIEYFFIPDLQTQVAAFKTGEIDIAENVPQDINQTYANKAEIRRVPYLVNNIYLFSAKQKVLQDIRVRQAISLAINRQDIVTILGGTQKALYGLIPWGVINPATGKDFRDEGGNLVKEDVALAKKLLADAGYPNGKDFPKLTWLYNNAQTHSDVAQTVEAALKKNLNIELQLKSLDSAAFSAERRAGNFDISRLGTSADYVDPTTWLNLYVSNTAYIQRVSGYQTPEFDKAMAESDSILDAGTRFKKLHEAEKLMIDSHWWIPISTYDIQILLKDKVKGIYTTTAGDIVLLYASIE